MDVCYNCGKPKELCIMEVYCEITPNHSLTVILPTRSVKPEVRSDLTFEEKAANKIRIRRVYGFINEKELSDIVFIKPG